MTNGLTNVNLRGTTIGFKYFKHFLMKFYLLTIIPVEGLIENASHAHRYQTCPISNMPKLKVDLP